MSQLELHYSKVEKDLEIIPTEHLKMILDDISNTRYYIPFIISLHTGARRGEILALTWDELAEMLSSGLLTVGSHTQSHPMLTKIPTEEVRQELLESKNLIEQHLSISVNHFSYPHSAYNMEIANELRLVGYKSATLGYGGSIRRGMESMLLNRKYIVQG
jgi:hypothetical protein